MYLPKAVPRTVFRECRINFYPDKKMTQRELAELLDVTETTIRNIESGRYRRVSDDLMLKSSKLFNCPVTTLFPEMNVLLNSHVV